MYDERTMVPEIVVSRIPSVKNVPEQPIMILESVEYLILNKYIIC